MFAVFERSLQSLRLIENRKKGLTPRSPRLMSSEVATWITPCASIDKFLDRFHKFRLLKVAAFSPTAGTALLRWRWQPWIIKLLIAVRMVRSDIPVAAATASMPPQPSERASAAAHRLRVRSSRSATIATYFSRIHSMT